MKKNLVLTLLYLGLIFSACTAAPVQTPPNETLVIEESPAQIEITVYFTDINRFVVGESPYEVGVSRTVSADANLLEAVLTAFFEGPTDEEKALGLEAVTSGCTGFSAVTLEDGIARVYLTGPCSSGGAAYTIAQLVFMNLHQFDEVDYVKIYDATGETEEPEGYSDSIPFSLEP